MLRPRSIDSRHTRASLLAVLLGWGCSIDDLPRVEDKVLAPLPKIERAPMPTARLADAEPLETTRLELSGEPYPIVPGTVGPTLHSGKWLGLASGDGFFLGDKHIVVNHFASRPDHVGEGDLIKNVILDVEAGEVVAEFEHGRYVQPHTGLLIAYLAGDERPYLFDVETEDFVLAVPEGDHDYRAHENYWINFSPIAKRVWIYARDDDGQVHLYEWEDRRRPPELPNNPFPFLPDPYMWDPRSPRAGFESLTEEVQSKPHARGPNDKPEPRVKSELRRLGCRHAILIPPKDYECLYGDLHETDPVSDGWHLGRRSNILYNLRDGRRLDLSTVCPDPERAFSKVDSRTPPRVEVFCGDEPDIWVVWTPEQLYRMTSEDLEYERRPHIHAFFTRESERLILYEFFGPQYEIRFDIENGVLELIGDDYGPDECPEQVHILPGEHMRGIGCKREAGAVKWFELADTRTKIRSRFRVSDMAIGPNGTAAGVIRHNDADRVVRLRPGRSR